MCESYRRFFKAFLSGGDFGGKLDVQQARGASAAAVFMLKAGRHPAPMCSSGSVSLCWEWLSSRRGIPFG